MDIGRKISTTEETIKAFDKSAMTIVDKKMELSKMLIDLLTEKKSDMELELYIQGPDGDSEKLRKLFLNLEDHWECLNRRQYSSEFKAWRNLTQRAMRSVEILEDYLASYNELLCIMREIIDNQLVSNQLLELLNDPSNSYNKINEAYLDVNYDFVSLSETINNLQKEYGSNILTEKQDSAAKKLIAEYEANIPSRYYDSNEVIILTSSSHSDNPNMDDLKESVLTEELLRYLS